MTSFLFRVEDENPVHVRVGVFAGPDREHRGKAGELVMAPSEWRDLHHIIQVGFFGTSASIRAEGGEDWAEVEFGRLVERAGGGWETEPLASEETNAPRT